ncbi:MAG TPA: twin-arginine translocase TatA/TatE family subunit [Pyrinomonadaceae bacterium]|jgi:TatA/E family protein of Tat protein translocase
MHTPLLVFEFLGTTELLVIAVVALVLFGPRKLPEIGRTVGKAIGEFKRASDDFKRTWEYEVEIERRNPAPAVREGGSVETAASLPAYDAGASDFDGSRARPAAHGPTVARGAAEEGERPGEPGLGDERAWDVATGRALTRTADKEDDELNAS